MVPVLPHIVGLFTGSNDEQTLGFLAVTLAFGVGLLWFAHPGALLTDMAGGPCC